MTCGNSIRLRCQRALGGGILCAVACGFASSAAAQTTPPAVVPSAAVSDEKTSAKKLHKATLLRGAFSTLDAQRVFNQSVATQSQAIGGKPFAAWMVDKLTSADPSTTRDAIDTAPPPPPSELPCVVLLVVSGRGPDSSLPSVRIGPIIVAREDLLPKAWWSFDVMLPPAPEAPPTTAPSSDAPPAADTSSEAAKLGKTHPTSDSITEFP